MGTYFVGIAAAILASVGSAAILGGAKWVRAVTVALGKLTEVAAQLSGVSEVAERTRADLAAHVIATERRFAAFGLPLHPRYLDDDNRPRRTVPAPAGSPE